MFKNINLKIAIYLGICKAASKTEWLYGTNPAFSYLDAGFIGDVAKHRKLVKKV